jgi:predicted GNAT family acetyltransferase
MADHATEVTVARARDRDRYEITVDDQLAGFAEYLDRNGQRIFYHTEIEQAFAGRGLGSVLISRALFDTRAAGQRIVPVCPFVKKYLDDHPEFGASVDSVTPNALAAVQERTG